MGKYGRTFHHSFYICTIPGILDMQLATILALSTTQIALLDMFILVVTLLYLNCSIKLCNIPFWQLYFIVLLFVNLQRDFLFLPER